MSVYILCIDTALSTCSVAIFKDKALIASAKDERINTASEHINMLIQNVCEKANLELKNINAIAIAFGPGSYTGLRIGVSIAKGISYALDIPIIAISTLEIMNYKALELYPKTDFYLPNIDARRDEIYFSLYDDKKNIEINEQPKILDESFKKIFETEKTFTIFGNATEKIKLFLEENKNNTYIIDFEYNATNIGQLAHQLFIEKSFVDTAYFEPNYIKPFFLHTKKA
jgi:tRNA threonylcarbamoyladenosine biosynthesis protein TsaB